MPVLNDGDLAHLTFSQLLDGVPTQAKHSQLIFGTITWLTMVTFRE
jgi:hypothetical protein